MGKKGQGLDPVAVAHQLQHLHKAVKQYVTPERVQKAGVVLKAAARGRVPPKKVAPQSVAAGPPVAFPASAGQNFFSETNRTKTSVRFRGASTFLVVGSQSGSSGNLVIPFSVHPLSFNDRLSTQATTYDKYVYHSIRAVYTPLVPTTQAGAVAMYFDRDVIDPPAPANNVRSIMSMERAAIGSCWGKVETSMVRDVHERRTYFINATTTDLRETEQFKLYLYLLGIGNVAGSYGYVTVHYDLELISPVLAPAESAAGTSLAYVQSSGNANFSASSTQTTTTPFGIPFTADSIGGGIVEVVLSDTLTASLGSGFTLGLGGAALASLRAGQPLYLRAGNVFNNNNINTVNWFVFLSLEDAITNAPRSLSNSNGAATNLFNSTVSVFWRLVANARLSSLVV